MQHGVWNGFCLYVRELVNLQVFMNTAGFVSSISKFRNNNIRLLNEIHITRAVHVSEQPLSRKLQEEEIAGGDFKFWMFAAPPIISPPLRIVVDLWICIFTENLCCCI